MIKHKKLVLPEIILFEPQIFEDDRGFFFEAFNKEEFNSIVKRNIEFLQDNHSRSKKNVLRGLHYQETPFEQAKLVRVVHGEVWDVAVDIRQDSKTYGQWVGEILSADNKKQLWIPEGFAHGFYVLSEFAEVIYKVNQVYSKSHERSIHWKNNTFDIRWPIQDNLVILSKKDDV